MKKSNYLFALALGASTLTFAQVGIGTSSPSNPLDIEATDAAIDINNTAADGDPALNFQLSGTTTFSIGIDDGDSDKLKIGTTAPDASTSVTIDASGNVGIGNSSPTRKLEVSGTIFSYPSTDAGNAVTFTSNDRVRGMDIIAPANGDGNAPFIFGTSNSFKFRIDGVKESIHIKTDGGVVINETGEANDFRVEGDTEANLLFVDGSADKVGIGTASPSVELDVIGDIEYTGTITDVSDRRLKENFSSIDSVLNKIMKIKGLSYNMINDSNKVREYGVIAQDVKAVFPEMVTTVDPENGYLGVAYIQLIPVLLEATKEQQAIIEAQKKEIAKEKAENESQKAEIESLKAEASNATSSSEENASEIEKLKAQLNALLQAQTATVSAVK